MSKTFTAQLNKQRISHRKLLLVENLVSGQSVGEARRRLTFSLQKGAALILRALNSAVAAAKEHGLSVDDLNLAEIQINKGQYLKRVKPASRGRMHRFNKPTSHILVKVVKKEAKN